MAVGAMLFYATNDVSMDALFALEVQFFVRRSGKLFKDATETVNDSQTAASDGKFSISANVHFEHEPTL